MTEVAMGKTANRSVVGTMNEFSFLSERYRESLETSDLAALSMRLAHTPCSPITILASFMVDRGLEISRLFGSPAGRGCPAK